MAQYDVVVKAVDQTKATFRGVEGGLKNIQTRADQANAAVSKLNTQLVALADRGAIAFAAASTTALRFADAVQDASEATTISTARILAFSQGVASSGGEASKAIDAITKFSQTIGEAAAGSQGARDAFEKVGVSLRELGTLSEEELLGQVVQGLAGISDASTRAAIQADLFGKTLKGVNIGGFAGDLERATEAQRANAEAIKSGAQLVDTLKNAYNRLELAILKAIKPLADWINAASPEQVDRFVNAIVQLGIAITGLSVGLKVLSAIGTALTGLAGYFALAGAGAVSLGVTFSALGTRLRGLGKDLAAAKSLGDVFSAVWLSIKTNATKTLPYLLGGLGRVAAGLTGIGGVATAGAFAIDALFGTSIVDKFVSGVSRAYNAVKEFIGLGDKGAGAGRGSMGGPTAEELARYQAEQDALKKSRETAAGGGRPIADQTMMAFTKSIADARKEYAAFLPLLKSSDPAVAAAALEKVNSAAKTLQITLSDDIILRNFNAQFKEQQETLRQQQVVYRDSANVLKEYNLELDKQGLEIAKNNVILGSSAAVIRGYTLELTKQEQELQKNAIILSDTNNILRANNIELAKQEQELRRSAAVLADSATQQRTFNIEIEKSRQSFAQQANTANLAATAYNAGRISLQEYLKVLQGVDQALLSTEQRQLQFNETISKGLTDAAETAKFAQAALADAYNSGDLERYLKIYEQYKNVLGTTATGELASARKAAKDEIKTTQDRAAALKILTEEYKKNGGTGTAEYRKVAEALGMSTEAIDRMVNVHGSAIDRMVEDARFYEQSIERAAGTFSNEFTKAFMEGRNVLDSFRNFFSNIANDIANRIIKQQLADPIADALSGIVGKVIGGMGSGGGGGGGFFSSIISGVGGFLGDIFGGFFADGGMLGAGQFGIVGEQGPELITGPANITPMDDVKRDDGNLQVVFQIQAIDTQTGAQFLLQNKPLITSMITQAYNSRGRRGPLD